MQVIWALKIDFFTFKQLSIGDIQVPIASIATLQAIRQKGLTNFAIHVQTRAEMLNNQYTDIVDCHQPITTNNTCWNFYQQNIYLTSPKIIQNIF